jgi:hypothetical protein
MNKLRLWLLLITLIFSKNTILYSGIPVYNPGLNSINQNQTDLIVNTGFRIHPDTVTQVEPTVATHPGNPNIIACSCLTDVYPGGYTTGAYVSTNGGLNWSGTNAIKDSTGLIITTVGNPKIIIDKYGTMILTFIAPNPLGGNIFKIGVSYSTNNGSYWSRTVYVPGVDTADKPTSATDASVSSPYSGRSYVVYNERRGIFFSCTTDKGKTWSTVKRISPPVNYIRTGAYIATGPNGEIYVTWPYLKDADKYIGFAKSTDGGATWDSTDFSIPVFPVKTDFRINLNLVKTNVIPVIGVDNSGGQRNGWIYVVCGERINASTPAVDSCDLIVHCSTDKGVTWPYKYRVNQDTGPTLKYQTFPAINIDQSGGINVLYFDTRNSPTKDTFEVYVSRSADGGQTFEDAKVSEHKFKLKQLVSSKWLFGIPSYIGTGIGITSSGSNIIPMWFDNFVDDEYQAWTSVINTTPVSTVRIIPEGLYETSANTLNCRDTIKVYLHNTVSPYSIIDSAQGVADTSTMMTELLFRNAVSGNYFLQVKHRNSLSVWSSNPVNYSQTSGLNYDFISNPNMSYGNNMVLKGSKYCLYSGDVNQDGTIDIDDLSIVENYSSANTSGYCPADVNGDLIVDSSDMIFIDNNSYNNICTIFP